MANAAHLSTSGAKSLEEQEPSRLSVSFIPRSIIEKRDGTLCICEANKPKLYLVDSDGTIKGVPLNRPICDIAVCKTTDTLFTISSDDPNVTSVDITDSDKPQETSIFKTDEMSTCICIASEDRFIIAELEKPIVIVYSKAGERLKTCCLEGNANHISVSAMTGNVAIACFNFGVKIMDTDLLKLREYVHHNLDALDDHSLDAWDVDFDKDGKLLVADEFNKRVVVLDVEPDPQSSNHVISSDKMGLTRCVIYRSNGNMLVGTDNNGSYELLTFKYKG